MCGQQTRSLYSCAQCPYLECAGCFEAQAAVAAPEVPAVLVGAALTVAGDVTVRLPASEPQSGVPIAAPLLGTPTDCTGPSVPASLLAAAQDIALPLAANLLTHAVVSMHAVSELTE